MKIVIDIPEDLYNNIRKGGFWLESGLTLSDAYDFIKYGTPAPNEDKWIPVSERLPDIAEKCIAQLTDGYITKGSYLGIDKWMFKELSVKYSYPTKCVIAWQPLPEPYTENNYDTSDT